MGKRERFSDPDMPQMKTQEEIDAYNAVVNKRIDENSGRVPPPPNRGLTEQCRIWGGYKRESGYGLLWYNGKQIGSHVAGLMIGKRVNTLPDKDENGAELQAAHKCDVRACCEPSHLYLATREENGEDRTRSGVSRGKNATISEETARAIKLSLGEGTAQQRAEMFDVTLSVVRNIDHGTAWSYLPDAGGNNSEDKRLNHRKKRKIRKKLLKEQPWSKEMYDIAQAKLADPGYVREHETRSSNGTKCKIWIRTIAHGYPIMYVGGRSIRAHIMACAIGNNFSRPDGLQAAHNCGESTCVNPQHLAFKTQSENAADKAVHGTDGRKLTSEQVSDIRERFQKGESRKSIASSYDVHYQHVVGIINGNARKNG